VADLLPLFLDEGDGLTLLALLCNAGAKDWPSRAADPRLYALKAKVVRWACLAAWRERSWRDGHQGMPIYFFETRLLLDGGALQLAFHSSSRVTRSRICPKTGRLRAVTPGAISRPSRGHWRSPMPTWLNVAYCLGEANTVKAPNIEWLQRCPDIAEHLSAKDVQEWALNPSGGRALLTSETGLELTIRRDKRRLVITGWFGDMQGFVGRRLSSDGMCYEGVNCRSESCCFSDGARSTSTASRVSQSHPTVIVIRWNSPPKSTKPLAWAKPALARTNPTRKTTPVTAE
jgi:hypothetical protein